MERRLLALMVSLASAMACRREARAPSPVVPVPAAPSASVFRIVDPARLAVAARTKAFHADAADGRVFAFDPEVQTLRGFDLATGGELWKSPLGVAPSGRVTLHPSYGSAKRVLVHVQNQLLLFDPATGALVAQHDGPWSQEKTVLSTDHGACCFSTDCDLHLVDCEDAHPYGPVLRIAVTHLYKKIGEPHDNVCWGPRHLVGRGGVVVVAVTDGRTLEEPKTGPVTLGIEVGTGKVAWSTSALGCEHCLSSGVSLDGATCWLASPDGTLDVFACATGKRRFQKKLPKEAIADTQPNVFTTWASNGIFVSTATEASLLDPASGKAVWSTPLPPKALGLPLGTRLELDLFSTWDARTVLLLDPKSGKETTRFELPSYTELLQSTDLGLRVKGGPAFDDKGKPRTFTEDAPLFTLVRDQMPRLLQTPEGHTLAEVTTDLAIVAARRTPQGDELALYVWGPPKTTGELIFARFSR